MPAIIFPIPALPIPNPVTARINPSSNDATHSSRIMALSLGVLFYIIRKNRIMQILVLLILSVLVYIAGNRIQCIMGLATIPILLYNGKRGYGMKNFFYIFYPAHIGILYILSALIIP